MTFRTQYDNYQYGIYAILFAHLILALTSDGPSNVAPLNRTVLTQNRRPEQTDNPVELLVALRGYLADLTPEAPRTLRTEYTDMLSTEIYMNNSLATRPWATQNTSKATALLFMNPSPTFISHTPKVYQPTTSPLAPHKPPATITLPRPPKSTLLTPMLASLIRGFRNFRVFFFTLGWAGFQPATLVRFYRAYPSGTVRW
jgi:hypothetical protein